MTIVDGRVVILTGAAGGLGRVMATGLVRSGARVVAVDVAAADAPMRDLVGEVEGMGRRAYIAPMVADITSDAECRRVTEKAIEHFGRVDALVNNAGLFINTITSTVMSAPPKFYDVSTDQWVAIINTNVNGSFFMAKAVVPHLLAQKSGRIVNVVTSYTTMVRAGLSPYGPSKAALETATANWAGDLQGTGVTVNALLPGGASDTNMIPSIDVPDRAALLPPAVMVAPVVWLTSASSGKWTGYRFIGKDWDPDGDADENVRRAGSLAAWRTV